MEPREQFQKLMRSRLAGWRREVLVETLAQGEPTLGDLLSLLDEDAYPLEPDDEVTIGELVGVGVVGPRVTELLAQLELPLESPLDSADGLALGMPLRSLLGSSRDG